MDLNNVNVEEIVKQVILNMENKNAGGSCSGKCQGNGSCHSTAAGKEIPKTAHVAMLTSLEHFDVKEFPIPEVGDDDILVKVEGCGDGISEI